MAATAHSNPVPDVPDCCRGSALPVQLCVWEGLLGISLAGFGRGMRLDIHGKHVGVVVLTPVFRDVDRGEESTIGFNCKMFTPRYNGMNEPDDPTVRIRINELRRFVTDLEAFERHRQGSVTLLGLDPEMFKLSLQVFDRPGHVLLTGTMRERGFEGTSFNLGISIGFEIEPSSLPSILRDFEDLIAWPQITPPTE